MTFDNEWVCKACGAVGINELQSEDNVLGDKVMGSIKLIVCECGHSEIIEDYEEDYDYDYDYGKKGEELD